VRFLISTSIEIWSVFKVHEILENNLIKKKIYFKKKKFRSKNVATTKPAITFGSTDDEVTLK
jgi:hypothetical protein